MIDLNKIKDRLPIGVSEPAPPEYVNRPRLPPAPQQIKPGAEDYAARAYQDYLSSQKPTPLSTQSSYGMPYMPRQNTMPQYGNPTALTAAYRQAAQPKLPATVTAGERVKAFGNAGYSGLTSFNRNLLNVPKAVEDVAKKILHTPDDAGLFTGVQKHYANIDNAAQQQVQQDIADKKIGVVSAGLTQGVVSAIPSVAAAMASGGASAAPQLGNASATLGGQVLTGMKSLAANPAFKLSVLRTFGNSYETALNDGANVFQAVNAAVLSSVPQGIIEVSGGSEKLVAGLLRGKQGLSGKVLQSALEEGLEEILQYPFEGLAKKATYQPNLPLYSTTQQAVINPVEQAKNAAMGGAVGLVMGGGAKVIDSVARAGVKPVESLQAAPGAAVVQEHSGGNNKASSQEILQKLRENITDMQDMPTVKHLTGQEFPKSDKRLTEQVGDFFRSIGNKVTRKGLGDVILDEAGVQSDIAHGLGRAKSITFAAVPEVIKYGQQIDYQENWKNRGYDTFVFAAPVTIGNAKSYIAAVVTKDKANRFYLHEVLDQNGNVIFAKKEEPGIIKTGVTAQGGITSEPSSSYNTTIAQGYNGVNTQSIQPFERNTMGAAQVKDEITDGTKELAKILPQGAGVETANSTLTVLKHDTTGKLAKFKQAYRGLYQVTMSGQAPLERLDQLQSKAIGDSIINANTQLYRQSGGVIDTICETALIDPNGNALGVSYNDIMNTVPTKDWSVFNSYRENLHNIDRQAQGKPVNANTAEQSRQIVADYEKAHPEWARAVSDQNKWWNMFTRKWLVETGLITEQQYKAMREMYPNYIPTYRVDKNPGGSGIFGGTITPKALGTAKGGTSDIIPMQEQFIAQANKIVKQARRNDIGRELLEFARSKPELSAKGGVVIAQDANEIVGNLLTEDGLDNFERAGLKQLDDGRYKFVVMENGKPTTLYISDDVYKAVDWLRDGGINNKYIKAFVDVGNSLTALPKTWITGKNPLFILSNWFRDVQTYAINHTGEHGVSNYFKAAREIATNGQQYQTLRGLGGLRSGYFNAKEGYSASLAKAGKPQTFYGKVKRYNPASLFFSGVGKISEFVENVPRMAEYMNVIDQYGDTDTSRKKAALASQDVTVNFTRSAPFTKGVNAWTMYLNAAVQGVDKTARQLKAHPIKTLTNVALTVAVPTLVLSLVNLGNANYDELDERTKDSYFCIPNFFGEKDEKGYPKTFIKLPKSREYGIVLGASLDRIFQMVESGDTYNPFDVDFVLSAWENFAPPDFISENILSMYSRIGLFDENNPGKTWYGGDIVPMSLQGKPAREQYDVNTSGVARLAGQQLNLSPKKLDNIIDSYGGYAGDLLQAATSPKNKGKTAEETAKNTFGAMVVQPMERKFTADPRYNSFPVAELYDQKDRYEKLANSDYATTYDKAYYSYLSDATANMGELYKQEKDIYAIPGTSEAKQLWSRKIRTQINDTAKLAMQEVEMYSKEYQKEYDAIVNYPQYSALPDDRKKDISDAAGSYAKAMGQYKVAQSKNEKYEFKRQNKNIHELSITGIPTGTCLIASDAQKDCDKSVDKRAAIDSAVSQMSFATREKLYRAFGVGLSEAAEKKYSYPSVQRTISKQDYYKVLHILDKVEANKDEFGNAITGTAKPKEIQEVAKALNVSSERAAEIYNELVIFDHALTDMTSKQQATYRDCVKGKSYSGEKLSEQQYIDCANKLKLVQGDKDRDGKTVSGSLKLNRYRALRDSGMSHNWAQWILFNVYGYKPPYS